jgi:L-alanine-DL-glutamate epimerase-like enolase superfamily enzyme
LIIDRIEVIKIKIPRSRTLTLSTYGQLGDGSFEFILTRVHTDEGIQGIGEVPPLPPLSPESQPVIATMIEKWLAPQLIGEDPFDIERIWAKMDFVAPTYPMSKAPLDMALYDIMGKTLGVPAHKLLGGSTVEKFPLVGLIGIGSEEEVVSEALRFVEEGYTGIRLKIGPGQDAGNVEAIREAVGDDVTIRVDGNQGYSVAEAVKAIRAMEPFGIELVEQPTPWWDFRGIADVAAAVDTPIMPHESIFQISDVKNLFDLGALGVLGLKTYRPGGGLTSARKLLDAARLMGVPCMLHDDVEMGVSLAAASQFIAARIGDLKFKAELSGYPEWIADYVEKTPLKMEGGYAHVPEGVGLGVELDPDKIEKYSTGIITCE